MKNIFKEVFYFTKNNKSEIWRIIEPFVFLMVFIGVPLDYFSEELGSLVWLYWLALLLIQPIYMCRLIRYMASVVTGDKPNMQVSFEAWFNLFVVYFLYMIAVLIGFILLIIPGVYLAARYGFAEFENVLGKKQPFESLSSSWKCTKDHVSVLIVGALIIWGVQILIGIPLAFMDSLNTEVYLLTELVSEVVSVIGIVLMSVFYFRVYELRKKSNNGG